MKLGRLTPKVMESHLLCSVLGRAQTSQHDIFGGLSCRVQLDPSSAKIDKQGIRPLRP